MRVRRDSGVGNGDDDDDDDDDANGIVVDGGGRGRVDGSLEGDMAVGAP